MKRAWQRAVLPVRWWQGPEPEPGDALETSTGRRYLIVRLKFGRQVTPGKLGALRALDTVVLPQDEPVEGKTHAWTWAHRGRRNTGASRISA